jgi:xanthine phosphoribosyltransferase
MIYPVSWQEIDNCCQQLARKVNDLPFSEIVAVSRGGLCPATMLSYELGKPIQLVDLPPLWSSDRSDILVVDDICDTGETFKELRQVFPHALYLSLFVKPKGKPLCDYWEHFVTQDTWVVFPWALHDQVKGAKYG